MRKVSGSLLAFVLFAAKVALAQPAPAEKSGNLQQPPVGATRPLSTPPSTTLIDSRTNSDASASGALSVPPETLMQQRLHEAAFPQESEFRCFLASSCEFGLTRGFTLGSDLGAMLGTPILGPFTSPGRWLVFDGFVGFQFLRAIDENVFFNAGIGYRVLQYKDSDERQASTSGMTFRVAYAQRMMSAYSQGVVVNGYYAVNNVDGVGEDFRFQASPEKRFVDRFYHFSQSFPRFRLGLPADLEFINWKNSHIDLPGHLRGYGRVEPFFIQNEFKASFPTINEYSFIERNVGLRLAYLMSYASPQERFGRLGVLGGIGLDVQASDDNVSYDARAPDYKVTLPKRKTLSLYWELGGSFQF